MNIEYLIRQLKEIIVRGDENSNIAREISDWLALQNNFDFDAFAIAMPHGDSGVGLYVKALALGYIQDDNKMFDHYCKAAELGLPEALLAKGVCLELGMRGAPNIDLVRQCYHKAGALGCAEGFSALASTYRELDGKFSDLGAVLHYSELSIRGGAVSGYGVLGAALLQRGSVFDKKRGVNTLIRGAEAGDVHSAYALVHIYEFGEYGLPTDRALAQHYREIWAGLMQRFTERYT